VLFAIVLWLIIYIKILIHPEILYGYPKLEEKLTKQNKTILNLGVWKLAPTEITNLQDQKLTIGIETKMTPYIQEMEDFINTNHPFRDPNFSIKDLSITLNIPTSHLAYIFKYHCNKPFVEYKKYCKIEDAKTLIKDNYLAKNTLESLCNEIGFISYNTFYSSFKKYNNVSPKAYLDSI
jgi:YesN/AraC family two-component response regulator